MRKDVAGYEDRYEVSSNGKVFNKITGKELKGTTTPKGYCAVKFYDGYKFKLHRLVAQAFIANPEEYPEIDHIDEDKTNNCVNNLRWCTNNMNKAWYWESRPRAIAKRVYGTIEDMVEATGKPITVNGIEFASCGSAAQYIVDNTEGKSKATISKELRRFLQGKRPAWVMYGQFTIGY